MRDWRTDEEVAAGDRNGRWLLLEAWLIALGLGAITVWGFAGLVGT